MVRVIRELFTYMIIMILTVPLPLTIFMHGMGYLPNLIEKSAVLVYIVFFFMEVIGIIFFGLWFLYQTDSVSEKSENDSESTTHTADQ